MVYLNILKIDIHNFINKLGSIKEPSYIIQHKIGYMYWLVESKEQLGLLINAGYKEAFIEVISNSPNLHPTESDILLVYLRPINASKGFMLCINHNEALQLDYNEIYVLLQKFNVLYTQDKKRLLHFLPLKTLWDITPPPTTYIQPTTQTHTIYQHNFKNRTDINQLIPIVKHYQVCEKMYEDLKNNITQDKTKYNEFFNNRVSMVFNAIERSGIRVDKSKFESHFHPIRAEYVYTQYNLKTTTTRPSNHFNGVNYAALNKENGSRASFIPQNNRFVEIDISAYHPTLAAMLIKYEFPTTDIHSHFAELYKVDYKKAKELTFKQLYGGVFDAYKDLEFFSKIQVYTNKMWDEYEKHGYIECPVSGFEYRKENLTNMNPQKLLNYILQNMETSVNTLVLWDMFHILRGYKTKLVLYTYDSFLLDVDDNEEEVLDKIREIFNKYKLSIKENTGYDYDFR